MAQQAYGVAQGYLGMGRMSQVDKLNSFLYKGGSGLSAQDRAWCADFVNASMRDAGMKGTGSGMARSFLNWGKPVDKPNIGDVAVFSRGGPNAATGHVGFFKGYNSDGSINVLGGNQGGAVNVSRYSADRLLGFRTGGPASAPTTPTIMQQARDPGYTKNTRSIAQPSSITPGAMSMPQTNTMVMSDKDSGGSLTLPNFGYPGAAENGWLVSSSPSVNGAGASGERVLNPSSGMMDNRLAPAADAPSTSGPVGAGWRDQPPRPAPGASPSPVAQPQQPPSSNGGAQWVNGTYGTGIQWGNGDTSFTRGPGNFAAGSLTDKPAPAPAPIGGGLAGGGVSSTQTKPMNWFKGLFGG